MSAPATQAVMKHAIVPVEEIVLTHSHFKISVKLKKIILNLKYQYNKKTHSHLKQLIVPSKTHSHFKISV